MKKYENIAQNIAEKIENEVYIERLPSERSLSKTYDVSINTIKNALNLLKEKNLIYPKHGSGHYIRHAKTYNMLNFKGHKNKLSKGGRIAANTLSFNIVRSTPEEADILEIKHNSLIYKIKRLRLIDDRPRYIENIIIPYDLLPELDECKLESSILKYAQSELNSSIDFTSNTVEAVSLTDEWADLLKENAGAPALLLRTHYFFKSGVKFAYYLTIHVNESFDFIQKP